MSNMHNGKQLYITTPIFYVNDAPHIGHAYTMIAADTLKRYYKQHGAEVFLSAGTDEYSLKNVHAAAAAGKDTKAFIDDTAAVWKTTWETLGIEFDDFVRTTEARHRAAVEQFWQAVKTNDDIYVGTYKGLYCVGCEEFKTESSLDDNGNCPLHQKTPDVVEEENYFFRASKYRDQLLAHIDANPDFIQPQSRRNEIRNYIQDHFTDVSISRESVDWGIPVPGESNKVIYVWFDALINYLTAIGYGNDQVDYSAWWPASVQIVGKDIIKFHCALWPAMLLSAGLPLPKQVFAHGHFTVNGQKMSKSLGNAYSPLDIKPELLRYYVLREILFGNDGDFSASHLEERYNGELANGLGNLVSRVTSMIDNYYDGTIDPEPRQADFGSRQQAAYHQAFERLQFSHALDAVWELIDDCNKYIEHTKPWELAKTDHNQLQTVLAHLLYALEMIADQLVPLMPDTAKKILQAITADKITKIEPLFPKYSD